MVRLRPPQPEAASATWRTECRPGDDPIDGIVDYVEETGADVVFMASDGPNGLLDVLRGSHTERVLRRAPCAVCAVPSV